MQDSTVHTARWLAAIKYTHRTERATACLLWLLTTASFAHAAATVTSLGYLPGDNYSYATAVSGDGSVVVGGSALQPYVGGGSYQAFRWTTNSGMLALGHLPGDNYSQAFGVSGDGSVIVGSSDTDYISAGQAFRWTAGSGMVGLGYLPGHTNSSAAAVSSNGLVIVGTSGLPGADSLYYQNYAGAPGRYEAFRWSTGSGMAGLGYLPGGTNSSAHGVSADGLVIVGTSSSASGNQAFRWSAGSGMVGLGYLPGDTSSSASGASTDGSVIIGTSSSSAGAQVFRWTAASGMVALGYLPGDQFSYGNAVNADGAVVVGQSFNSYLAFRWAGSGIQSLPIDGGFGVSADGNTIVGQGEQTDGRSIALVATITDSVAAGPTLSINSSLSTANQFVLCWPTNYAGLTLQSSSNLGATNWTNCANPTVSDSYFVVTDAIISAGSQFFRLKR
jgi:probable HAF family extracellular repeat protein